jgi:two-component system LytT family response regulator
MALSNQRVIRAVIVDDDLFIREELRESLKQLGSPVHIIGEFANPTDSVAFIQNFRPDLLFLDIQMPGMNGFQLLDELRGSLPAVIFVTSYDEYAIRAIRYSALDYLLKPIDPDELKAALNRYITYNSDQNIREKTAALQHNLSQQKSSSFHLVVPTRQGDMYFPSDKIVRLEADRNYTWIYLLDKPKFLASKPLKEFEDILTEQDFIRAHKSHLINKAFITRITQKHEIVLNDDTKIEVARRRWQEVRDEISRIL